jgi:hypothetical protein
MGGNYKASHLRKTTVQGHELTRIIHAHFFVNCERDKQGLRDRRDKKLEVLGSKFRTLQPSDRLTRPAFLASLAPRACRAHFAISRRTVINNAG